MCLVTKQKEPLIAKTNLHVYKILLKDLTSEHQNFQYELNSLYKTKIEKSRNPSFYSFIDGNRFINIQDAIKKNYQFLGSGYHSFRLKKFLKNHLHYYKLWSNQIIVKCLIPKGSEYYINEFGLCISNQIIIEKVIKL